MGSNQQPTHRPRGGNSTRHQREKTRKKWSLNYILVQVVALGASFYVGLVTGSSGGICVGVGVGAGANRGPQGGGMVDESRIEGIVEQRLQVGKMQRVGHCVILRVGD